MDNRSQNRSSSSSMRIIENIISIELFSHYLPVPDSFWSTVPGFNVFHVLFVKSPALNRFTMIKLPDIGLDIKISDFFTEVCISYKIRFS